MICGASNPNTEAMMPLMIVFLINGLRFPTVPDEEEAAQGEQTKNGRFGHGWCSVYGKLRQSAWNRLPIKTHNGGEKNSASNPPATYGGSECVCKTPLISAIGNRCSGGEHNIIHGAGRDRKSTR